MRVTPHIVLLLSLASGPGCEKKTTQTPTPTPASTATATATATATSTSTATATATSTATSTLPDGGGLCRRTFGPYALPFVGAPKLAIDDTDVAVLFNDHGTPRAARVNWKSPVAAPAVPPIGTNAPACATAGPRVFCASAERVYATTVRGTDRTSVTNARSRGAIAAASLGARGEHALVAWLEQHGSTEGPRLVAMGRVDDGEPFQISEEGSGATWLDIAEQGDRAIVVSIDARMSMVPVHAREVRLLESGKAKLGSDVVVSVGGAPSTGVRVAAGAARAGSVFAFLPDAKDARDFGLSLIRLEEPFHEESPRTWSIYPNGLDPAPVAATRRANAMWAAFARPASAAGKSVIVEITRVEESGSSQLVGFATPAEPPTELSLVIDPRDALWLAASGHTAATLERWECATTRAPK